METVGGGSVVRGTAAGGAGEAMVFGSGMSLVVAGSLVFPDGGLAGGVDFCFSCSA